MDGIQEEVPEVQEVLSEVSWEIHSEESSFCSSSEESDNEDSGDEISHVRKRSYRTVP